MVLEIDQWTSAMEEDYIERIKKVFDVCDADGTGYITVDHLKNLARDHFGADSDEETIGIIQLLDPEGKGKVNFQDFCSGVKQILEVQAQSKQSTPTNSGNYTEYINSFSLDDISPTEFHEASEASAFTYNEYDTNTDEDGGGLLIDFSTPETSRRHLHPGDLSGRSSVTSKTDEENFEDFGVGDDLESDISDQNLSGSDTYRKRSPRRRDLSSRHHRNKGPNRRVSSATYASQLQKGGRNPKEEVFDEIDGSFQELNERVQFLEQQLNQVSEEKGHEVLLQHRYKDENHVLIKSVVDRIHTLEEQLKDMEIKSEERVREEKRKYQEMASKNDSKEERMDYLTSRLHLFESENERLKMDSQRLRTENDKLKMDKLEMSDRLAAAQEDYNAVSAEYQEMMGKFDRERQVTGQLLDELQKELEDLRKFKIDTENKTNRTRNPSLSDSQNGAYSPLQQEMMKLKETLWLEWKSASKMNKSLTDENEELHAQLLNHCVQEGKKILRSGEGNSLAEELDHLTKEELMTALKEQQDVNFRLKQYVDKIILTILEKNPAMLEVH